MISGDDAVCPTCGQAYPIRVAHCANDGTKLVQRRAQAGGMEGRVVDNKYMIGPLLGEGMLGATYLGKQVTVDREVAIKLVRPAYSQDPAAAERFFVAARAACSLVAPSIVTAYDFGRLPEGVIYVVMEFVRGRSLALEISGQPMQVRRVISMAIQLCDALAPAHAVNLVHGELKPSNILMIDEAARRDVAKLADFGLARAIHPDVTLLDASRLAYIAPEVAAGGPIDGRADLYSLGCIMHEALTGKQPFTDASTRGMIERHAREIAPRLPRDVPPNLVKIIGKLMSKTREQRETAIAVRNALHAVLGTTPATSAFSAGDAVGTPRRGPTTDVITQKPKTGPSGVDRTVNEMQPAVLAQTGVRPAPGYGTQPDKTMIAVPGHEPQVQAARSGGIPRIVVILVVALILSGGGILAYVFLM